MKFTGSLTWDTIDLVKYRQALKKHLTQEAKESGIVWLHAAVEKIPIPTWSGASRATFQKLAREVGTSIPIGPQRSKKDRTALGTAAGSGSGLIINEGKNFYGFMYSSSLRYLNYNEFNRAVPVAGAGPPLPLWAPIQNTPYQFKAKGLEAWLAFAKTVDLPSPWATKFLKRTRIKI